MGYLKFRSELAEKWMMSFKWSRNNTLEILQSLTDVDLKLKPVGDKFQDLGFQFACLATTTDTYLRRITKHEDKSFGKLYLNGKMLTKSDLNTGQQLHQILEDQITQINDLLIDISGEVLVEHLRHLINISDHEYLHQGQLVSYFTWLGKALPSRFKKAWAL